MIINKLTDCDLYKFTQCQLVFHQAPPNLNVTYKFTDRTKTKYLLKLVDSYQLREEINHILSLKITDQEIQALKKLKYFRDDFIEFLKTVGGPNNPVSYQLMSRGDDMDLIFFGPWRYSIIYETLFLSLISELYTAEAMKICRDTQEINDEIKKRLFNQIDEIDYYDCDIKIVEFGTRRRESRVWQETIIERMLRSMPNNFIGTSNIDLGNKFEIKTIGTIAHESFMTWKAISHEFKDSQFDVLKAWYNEYCDFPELLIALSDTYGSDAFLRDFSRDNLYKMYSGVRQDSGNPYDFANKMIAFYEEHGVDPMTKKLIFSDGLDLDKAIRLHGEFSEKINVAFGIGTFLTHNCIVKPLQIVIKAHKASLVDEHDNIIKKFHLAKLSDDNGKYTGCPEAIQDAINTFLR